MVQENGSLDAPGTLLRIDLAYTSKNVMPANWGESNLRTTAGFANKAPSEGASPGSTWREFHLMPSPHADWSIRTYVRISSSDQAAPQPESWRRFPGVANEPGSRTATNTL